MIRGIIFDCFGVLYHGSLGYLRELTPPEKQQQLTDLSHSYDYGYIEQADYFEQVGLLLHRSSLEIETICRQQHVRNEALIDVAKSLRGSHRVALLSNVGRGFIDSLFTSQELDALFDVVVLSNEVGMAKPYPEIYELTAARIGLVPSECVMIDDSVENIEGAVRTSMRGIVYESMELAMPQLENLIEGDNA